MIAAAPPSIPAGVVAAAVSRSCFQRSGLLFLVASLRKCPITSSAIGSTEFALRTAFMPLFHTADSLAPRPPARSHTQNNPQPNLPPAPDRKARPAPPADRQTDIMHARQAECFERGGHIVRQPLHRVVVAGTWIAAAMPSHVQ